MSTEQFHYEVDGKEIVLPHFKHIPFGVIRKLRKESEGEQLFGLLEAVADKKTLAVLDGLGMEEIDAMFSAWQEASGIAVGESSASSTS